MPLFSAYAGWTARHGLGRPAPRPALGLLAAAAAAALLANLATADLVARALAIPLGVVAMILASHGVPAVRRLMLPLGFLLFLAPPPPFAIEWLSPLLQRLAAATAEQALRLLAIPVSRTGLQLQIGLDTLEITSACNGLRFLLTMAVVGVALAWAMGRTVRARLAIVTATVMTGLAANLARVTLTAVLSYVVGVVAATGPAHLVYGKLVYAVFGGVWLLTLWLAWGRPRQA